MPRIVTYDRIVDVEVPEGVPRSRAGAIRLAPGVATTVTLGELDVIKREGVRVVHLEDPVPTAAPAPKPKVKPAPEAKPAPEGADKADKATKAKSKGQRKGKG